jgi:hypothetical protein
VPSTMDREPVQEEVAPSTPVGTSRDADVLIDTYDIGTQINRSSHIVVSTSTHNYCRLSVSGCVVSQVRVAPHGRQHHVCLMNVASFDY